MKIILSVLIAVILIQCTLSKPIEDTTTSDESSSNEEFDVYMSEFRDLLNGYLNKAVNISEHIFKDQALVEHKSPVILEFKKNITEFVDKYKSNKATKDEDLLTEIIEMYDDNVTFHLETEKEELTDDTELIVNLLKKYKAEELNEEFEKIMATYIVKMMQMVQDVFGKISKQIHELATKSVLPVEHTENVSLKITQ